MRSLWTNLISDKWLLTAAIVQALLAILGVFVTLKEEWAKRRQWPVFSVFVVLGVVGLLASVEQGGESSRANDKLAASVQDLGQATREIGRVTSLNTDLQTKLLAQEETISGLAKRGIGSVTGGNSFCYLKLLSRDTQDGSFVLLSEGEFPLYEISIQAVDVGSLEDLRIRRGVPAWSFEEMESMTTYLQIATIPSHTAKTGIHIPIRNGTKADFNIFFSARNGFWSELVRLRKVNGLWTQATKVQVDFAGARTEQHRLPWTAVEQNFPQSELNWN